MRLFAFIRQRSFARYVAFDLAEAARQLGWDVVWMDLDGERQRLAALPEAQRPAAAAALRDRVAGHRLTDRLRFLPEVPADATAPCVARQSA